MTRHPRTAARAVLLAITALAAILVGGITTTAPASAATPTCIAGAAHRGNAYLGSAPENSLDAFRQSWNTGIRTVETDVWFTTDNVPVIMHDATVDRTTNGTGSVIAMTSAQFADLRLKDGQTPPTLDQVIDAVHADPKRRMLLELKRYLTAPQKKILLTKLAGHEDQIEITGFKWEQQSMIDMRRANPNLRATLNADAPVLPMPDTLQGENLMTATSPETIAAIHAAGGTVRLFGDTPTIWANAQAAGVDMIITNKAYAFQRWVWSGCSGGRPAA